MGTPAVPWTEIRPTTGLLGRLSVREVWSFREVAWMLAFRELKVRYKQTALGVLWVAIQPLAGVVLFTLVFGKLAGLPSDGMPYPLFVYAGLILWGYFAASAERATQSLVDDRELITKVFFPRLLAPAAALLPRLIDLVISLGVIAVAAALYGVTPGPEVVLVPVWIAGTVIVTFGAGLLFSALNVRYRDVGNAIGLLLQLWMFASPVVFASSSVHGWLRTVMSLNPLTGLLDGFRWSLLAAPAPPAVDLLSLVGAALLCTGGLVYFQRSERRFADLI